MFFYKYDTLFLIVYCTVNVSIISIKGDMTFSKALNMLYIYTEKYTYIQPLHKYLYMVYNTGII